MCWLHKTIRSSSFDDGWWCYLLGTFLNELDHQLRICALEQRRTSAKATEDRFQRSKSLFRHIALLPRLWNVGSSATLFESPIKHLPCFLYSANIPRTPLTFKRNPDCWAEECVQVWIATKLAKRSKYKGASATSATSCDHAIPDWSLHMPPFVNVSCRNKGLVNNQVSRKVKEI